MKRHQVEGAHGVGGWAAALCHGEACVCLRLTPGTGGTRPRLQGSSRCQWHVDTRFLQVLLPRPGLAQGLCGALPVNRRPPGLKPSRTGDESSSHYLCQTSGPPPALWVISLEIWCEIFVKNRCYRLSNSIHFPRQVL